MRHFHFVCLTWFIFIAQRPAWSLDCPSSLDAAPLKSPDQVIQITTNRVRLSETLPEYDPRNEFLFHYHANGHGVLYAGGWFQESSGNNSNHFDVVQHGVVVRVRVGEAYVKRIVEQIEGGKLHACKNSWTCQQRLFFLLEEAGISLKEGPFLLGSTTYRALLTEGFVGEGGKRFPQTVIALSLNETDTIERVFNKQVRYEIGVEHSFVKKIREKFQYSDEELKADMIAAGFSHLADHFAKVGFEPTIWKDLDASQRNTGHQVMLAFEHFLLSDLKSHFNLSERALFYHLHRNDLPPHYAAAGKQMLRSAFKNALQKVLGNPVRKTDPAQ